MATSAAIATSSLVAAHADAPHVGVRLADSNAFKRAETGPQVQLLQPGYSATLKGTDVPIVVKIAGRTFAPKSLELFVDGLNASNGAIALDSSPTVELKWDTTLFPDGIHRLTVRVTDVQGFIGQSETQVFINNKGQVDTTAPVLSWLNVSDGDRLKGEVNIQLKASDNFGVKYIFVSINPAITPTRKPPLRQYLVNRPPYAFLFDTTKVPDGVYVLDALAWDALENEGKAPTRTFGVLNNALNATLLNDLAKFAGASHLAAAPGEASTDPAPSTAPVTNLGASTTGTTSVGANPAASGGSRPAGPQFATNFGSAGVPPQSRQVDRVVTPAGPPVLAESPAQRPVSVPSYTAPSDNSLTIATGERRGAASPGTRKNIVPAVRETPGLLASVPDAPARAVKAGALNPMRIAELPRVAPAQSNEPGSASIAASEFSVTSRAAAGADQSHRVAELRATAPSTRKAGGERLAQGDAPLPRFPQQAASPLQTGTVSETAEFAVATRRAKVSEERREFAPRFTAPPALERYAVAAETTPAAVAQVGPAGAPAVSVSSTSIGTAPSARRAPVPVAAGTPATHDSLPASIQRLVRASLEAPRPVAGTLEAALSLTATPQGTATSTLRAPRVDVSNVMRSGLNLDSFQRLASGTAAGPAAALLATTEPGPAPVFVSAAQPSSHGATVPRTARATAPRATLPAFPRVNETPAAATVSGTRLSALPRPSVQPRNMRNSISVVPTRQAMSLPASFTAPHETFLSAVAAQYDVPLDMLATVNNLKANARLARGQEILFPREISVRYAGKPVTGDVASLMVGSTSVTAFRFLFEQNGGTMTWDAAKQRVIAKDKDKEVILTIGSKTAVVNRKEEAMEMAAFLLSGRTMVPVRFFEKTMAARVEWEPATGRLLVSVANPSTLG